GAAVADDSRIARVVRGAGVGGGVRGVVVGHRGRSNGVIGHPRVVLHHGRRIRRRSGLGRFDGGVGWRVGIGRTVLGAAGGEGKCARDGEQGNAGFHGDLLGGGHG